MSETSKPSDIWGPVTGWTLVLSAANASGADASEAWRALIERYREPVRIAFLRRLRGHPDADQATADFFAHLFEHNVLSKVDRETGRFRCYMQGVIWRYAHQWLREKSTDAADVDAELDRIGASEEDALEREDEIQWASKVLCNALARLEQTHPRDAEFVTRIYGLGGRILSPRNDLRAEFGLTETAFDVALHRARGRLHDKLVEEVRETVYSGDDVEDEVKLLLARLPQAFSGP